VYTKGDKVVHPRHGAAVIECLIDLETSGERLTYFKLRLPRGLTVMIPVNSADEVGIRGVLGSEGLDALFDLLRQEEGPTPSTWTQRHKLNLAKVHSGDLYQGAEVIRDLSHLRRRAHLSTSEQRMLAHARENLISELAFTLDVTLEDAEAALDAALECAPAS
jgi:CarD family transcriptional regulator